MTDTAGLKSTNQLQSECLHAYHCIVSLEPQPPSTLKLCSIVSRYQNLGNATKCIDYIKKVARAHGITRIILTASPIDISSPADPNFLQEGCVKLEQWYKKLGFKTMLYNMDKDDKVYSVEMVCLL